ncbi:hypothetical protein ACWIGI_16550 [Nocardia sp. NPDC055321]
MTAQSGKSDSCGSERRAFETVDSSSTGRMRAAEPAVKKGDSVVHVRIAWVVVAVVAAALGVLAASSSMMQITSCELGLLPSEGIATGAECEQRIAEFYGGKAVFILALPVLLCVLSAIAPHRWISALSAVTILGCVAAAFVAPVPANEPPPVIVAYVFYLPAAVLAILLTGYQAMLGVGGLADPEPS